MSTFLQVTGGALEGDFAIVNNQFAMANGSQEVLQLLRARLRMQMGSESENVTLGTPYFGTIFDKGTPITTVEGILKHVIETTPGVEQVQSLSVAVDKNTRNATTTFTALVQGQPFTATVSFP